MSFEDALDTTASTERETSTTDGMGGTTQAWGENLASYKCRIAKGSGGIVMMELGREVPTTHTMVGTVADVLAGDHLIVGTAKYLVLSAIVLGKPIAQHHLEANLRRLN